MGILNNMWMSLTTENELLSNILSTPLVIIEVTLSFLLFSFILNISSSKKQKFIYILFASALGIICTFAIPKPYSNIITLIVTPLAIIYIFKVSLFKGIMAEFIPVICITILEILFIRIFLLIFGTNYESCFNIPIYRMFMLLLIYLTMFLLYKLAKKFNFNINMLDNIKGANRKMVLINIIFAIIVLFMQMYLICFYDDILPSYIIIINILSLFAYFLASIYSIIKSMNLEKAQEDLNQEKEYNKTLQILHDSVRAFKHDFSNIIAGIGGYVETDDMPRIKEILSRIITRLWAS